MIELLSMATSSFLTKLAVRFVTCFAKKTGEAFRNLFSEDEAKVVLAQAFMEFKESAIFESKGAKDEKVLLEIFEEFLSDDRALREFQWVFDAQSQKLDFNLLEEIFVGICINKNIEIPQFNFFQAIEHVIKGIQQLAQQEGNLQGLFQTAHLEKIYSYLQKRGTEANVTFARFKYLDQLKKHHNRLLFAGIPDLEEKKDVELPAIFVMPRVRESVSAEDHRDLMRERQGDDEFAGEEIQLRLMMTKKEEKTPVKFAKVFEESTNRCFVVLGNPGSGKSTLLKYLALEAARLHLEFHRDSDSFLFPILVEIRKLENALSETNRMDYNILDFLYDSVRSHYNLTLPDGFFEEYLGSGRALLLFDGLDEVVAEARRSEIQQMINAFVNSYPLGNTVIVTSRIVGYNRAQFSTADYRHFTLEDFDAEEIDIFSERALEDRQSSIEMADDIKIIEQIEKQIGKKLKPLPLKDIMESRNNGYVLDHAGQVQGLNLDDTKVKDISILRNLGGLTHLSLANNQITDITPLRTLTHLKKLRLSQNKITDITAMTTLSNLEELFLNANHRISDISSLSGLTGITHLSLSHNKIISLYPLTTLTRLKILWLSSNNIDDLTPLKALTQLETLGVGANRITDLTPLKELTNLKELDVSKNNITKLPPDIDRWWSSMEIIWVDNDATDKGLNLFDNPLTDPPVEIVKQGKAAVKKYFDSLGDKQSPIVPAADIKIIEQIEKQIRKELKPLLLENIIKIGNNGFAIDNAGQVQGLNLDDTKVKDISILRNLGGLTHLSLANNQITDITPLGTLTKLTELDLRKNQITNLTPLSPLTMLRTLILERNQITNLIPLRELKNLTVLNLHDNKLTDITHLQDMAKLTELYLSKNKIMKFTVLCSFKNLKRLGLGNSGITDFAITLLSALTNLEKLALYENQITDITPLRELKNLKVLDVRRNRIEKLPPEIITWWPNLEIKWEDNFIPGLILLGNPLTDPPVEIVKKGKAAVKKYFDSLGDSQSSIQRVNELVARWHAGIKIQNAVDFYDINRISEDIAAKLLNEIYNLHLEILNYEKNNYPCVDLGDKHNKIAFEITTRSDAQKIKDTLKKFTEGPKDIYSNGIRFLILSEIKPRFQSKVHKIFQDVYPEFNPNEHILTPNDLMLEIKKLYENDKQRFNRIKSILEKEIGGMDTKKREKIFISYSHKDGQWVTEWLLPRLEGTGAQVHIDSRDFEIGRPALINMETAVKECKWTFLVLTPHWIDSQWTLFEGLMLQYRDPTNLNKCMLPLMLEKCNLPDRLSLFTYADFTEKNNWETQLGRLLGQMGIAYTPGPVPGTMVVKPMEEDVSLYKLPVTGDRLFGREKELKLLDNAWTDDQTAVLALVAWGGVGKTALVNQWLNQMKTANYRGAQKVFGWSFYSQGAEEGKQASADEFFQETLQWFGDVNPEAGSAVAKGRRLARLARQQKSLLILDGLEPLQYPPGEVTGLEGKLKDNGLAAFLKELAGSNAGNKVLCVITTREPVTDLLNRKGYGVEEIPLEHLSESAGVALLKSLGVTAGSATDFHSAVTEYGGHAQALTLLGHYIKSVLGGDIRRRYEIPQLMGVKSREGHNTQQVMEEWVYKLNIFISRELGLKKHPILKNEDLRTIKCPACNGTREEMCISCLGSGMMGDSSCSNCFGSGKTICSYCGGTSWVSTKEREEYIQKVHYNDEAIVLIRKKNYEEALLIIMDAENQNCADNNTRALKEKVIKSLSDDVEQSFKKQTKEGSNIDYPQAGSIQGRDGDIEDAIEILDRIPIVTVYGIPGIGKSTFIHELRKRKPHNNRLYKRIIAKPGMTVNELFQHLALPLGCRNLLDQPDFELSMQPDFSYLKKEAQYRLDSFIHLDDAQFLFCQNGFHQSVIKDFLIAITQFYSGIRIILESRIIPPVGIFPEKIHKSVRIQGIDKESMRLYFHKPFKDDNFGWDLIGNEQESILKNFGGIKEKEKIHPLAMTLLASMAKQTHNTPAEILKNTDTLQKFRDESRELLLDDLNLLASQTENWNIPQNLEMYHEDIPGYLSESLQKSINELFPGSIIEAPPVSDTITDNLEKELRKAVSEESYLEGKKLLLEIKDLDLDRFECLKEEFGFIYDFDNPETDETNRKPKQGQLQWRRKVWQFLSMRNNFEIPDSDLGEVEKEKTNIPEAQADIGDGIRDRKIPVAKDKKTSEAIGEDLEKAVLKLFKDFFAIMEEDNTLILENARQQGRGLQFGHDLKFVCGRLGNKEIRLLIECKNYSDKITTKDIADKLMEVEDYYDVIPIDHWILISPHADLANELERFIEKWENKGKYPFKVQTWTPATRVKEFFGLDPDIYDRIIKAHDLNIHPKEWSADKRKGIIEYWKEKLEPPLRLPQGWQDYLREPDKLLLEQKEKEFEKRFANDEYVKMNYKDETGPAFAQPLEEKILQWLEEPVSESPTIFLLGEFGDGKTFFTYVLTRKLAEKFRASPKEGWLPVRFALKNFESEGFNRTQDFIQHRLNDFRADIAGWNELRSRGYKLLAILDGFDEISKGLDPKTILSNINILIKCYTSDYFSDMKLMITSRKHFFENQKDKDKLLDKLDKPQLLHLSPIDRKTTEDYLRMYAARIGKEENFNKIKECHDPIGLASKPLFLEMVQVSLNEPPGKNLNEYILYEDYIKKALKRKKEYSSDNENETPMEEIIENLKNVLELVAQRLHQSDREYVFLSDIREKEELKAWLWELSDPDTTCIADETGHIAARSLLKRVDAGGQHADKQWPVDFCHRSMREYFVARAVCNMVEKKLEEAEKFLTGCVLSHEIVFFAGEIMKNKSKDCDYEKHLLKLIEKTRNVENIKRMDLKHLGGNAINLFYQYKNLLPEYDWRNLVLDGAILPDADLSGKDFSNTSLQYANLDNVNFTNSNFSNCNLTDVRIEETAPVQGIAVSPDDNILALYHDGIIREWQYQRLQRPHSTNLDTGPGIGGKELKMIAQPGNDLTILDDRYLYFYDRDGQKLKLKATIEVNPGIRLIKASREYLLLNEVKGRQNRLILVDLNELAIVKTFPCSSFTLCDHLERQALVICNEKEELHVRDISGEKRAALVIPAQGKISCLATCKCSRLPGGYLLGLGLYNGAVQIWKIQVEQWTSEKLSEQLLHEQGKPIKDLSFIDDGRIVCGSLDKTIKLLTFSTEGKAAGDVKEFKMTLQCRGMKIDGVTREKIEGKKLGELIAKAAQVQ